jgi:hypothetical protein
VRWASWGLGLVVAGPGFDPQGVPRGFAGPDACGSHRAAPRGRAARSSPRRQIEVGEQLRGPDRGTLSGRPDPPSAPARPPRLRGGPRLAQGAEVRGPVALAELGPARPEDQRDVGVRRRRQTERALQEDLPRRASRGGRRRGPPSRSASPRRRRRPRAGRPTLRRRGAARSRRPRARRPARTVPAGDRRTRRRRPARASGSPAAGPCAAAPARRCPGTRPRRSRPWSAGRAAACPRASARIRGEARERGGVALAASLWRYGPRGPPTSGPSSQSRPSHARSR